MALDTIKLRSPALAPDVAALVAGCLQLRQAIDCPTGELLYSLTTGTLEGSWDSRISLRVMYEEWVTVPRLSDPKHRDTFLRACEPYLLVEGSVHKALLGHNVFGGPCDLLAASRWFVAHLAEQIGCDLPIADGWQVRKVDWAEVYKLPYEAIEQYVHGLNNAAFPRRTVGRYGDQSLSCPGSTSTVKVYHKGPEFSKHDRKRLKGQLSDGNLAQLQETANDLLRVEVSIKAAKLDRDFGGPPTVGQLTDAYVIGVYDREVARLLREGGMAMKTVRKHREVRDRLYEVYDPRLAGLLFGTWMQLVALGEDVTREKMSRPTFYRQRKQLQDAAIAWHGGDVRIVEVATILPADFSPVRADPRRLVGEAPEVLEKLLPFRDLAA